MKKVITLSIKQSDTAQRILDTAERLFSLLVNTMKEALPELPEEVLIWRLFFTTGALAQAMRMFAGNVPVPDKISLADDTAVVAGLLLTFVTCGILHPRPGRSGKS